MIKRIAVAIGLAVSIQMTSTSAFAYTWHQEPGCAASIARRTTWYPDDVWTIDCAPISGARGIWRYTTGSVWEPHGLIGGAKTIYVDIDNQPHVLDTAGRLWGFGGGTYWVLENSGQNWNIGAATGQNAHTETWGLSSVGQYRYLYRWQDSPYYNWVYVNAPNYYGEQIVIDAQGNPWMRDTSNRIFKGTNSYSPTWTQVSGTSAWLGPGDITSLGVGDHSVWHWSGTGWTWLANSTPHAPTAQITGGWVWAINTSGEIFHLE